MSEREEKFNSLLLSIPYSVESQCLSGSAGGTHLPSSLALDPAICSDSRIHASFQAGKVVISQHSKALHMHNLVIQKCGDSQPRSIQSLSFVGQLPNRLSIQTIWTGFDDLNGIVVVQKINLLLFN